MREIFFGFVPFILFSGELCGDFVRFYGLSFLRLVLVVGSRDCSKGLVAELFELLEVKFKRVSRRLLLSFRV